jgi:hypothetical protein
MNLEKVRSVLATVRSAGFVKYYSGIGWVDPFGIPHYEVSWELGYRVAEVTFRGDGRIFFRVGMQLDTREVETSEQLRYYLGMLKPTVTNE